MTARPERTCIVCRRVRPKGELARVVRRADGSVAIDRDGRAQGRGAYVCAEPRCLARAAGRLGRALRAEGIDVERVRAALADLGAR